MEITFDPVKDAANRAKHGIRLVMAAHIEWDELYAVPDIRWGYGEQRMVGIGYIGPRLFVVVYVDRDEVRRVISLRKANRREVNNYAQA